MSQPETATGSATRQAPSVSAEVEALEAAVRLLGAVSGLTPIAIEIRGSAAAHLQARFRAYLRGGVSPLTTDAEARAVIKLAARRLRLAAEALRTAASRLRAARDAFGANQTHRASVDTDAAAADLVGEES